MLRGPIFIESRLDEGGTRCHQLAAVALQAFQDLLNFIQGAALIEGKVENPECRALLNKLIKWSKTAPSLRELCSTASTIFGVEKSKMRQILTNFDSVCEAEGRADGKADGVEAGRAFNMALLELREGNPGDTAGPPPSCYFDPSNSLTKSDYSMGAPLYEFDIPMRFWHVVRWLGYVAELRDARFEYTRMAGDALAQHRWFEATMADALIRLYHECNQEDVWKVLESAGIKLTPGLKDAVIKQLKGDSSGFNGRKRHQIHWNFERKVYDDAKKRWADKWADHFAEELNNSARGIVRYGKNEIYNPQLATKLSGVERWIRQNTIYGTDWGQKQCLGFHEKFMRALESYCRKAWYGDIGLAVERHRGRARRFLEESSRSSSLLSSIVCTRSVQTSVEVLKSELMNLGLTLTEPAMKIIGTLTEASDDSLQFQQQPFKVDPAVVVHHAASQIKAVFSPLKPSENRKRSHE